MGVRICLSKRIGIGEEVLNSVSFGVDVCILEDLVIWIVWNVQFTLVDLVCGLYKDSYSLEN